MLSAFFIDWLIFSFFFFILLNGGVVTQALEIALPTWKTTPLIKPKHLLLINFLWQGL